MCSPIFNQSDTNNFHPTDFRGFKTTPHLITRLQEKAAICISLYLTSFRWTDYPTHNVPFIFLPSPLSNIKIHFTYLNNTKVSKYQTINKIKSCSKNLPILKGSSSELSSSTKKLFLLFLLSCRFPCHAFISASPKSQTITYIETQMTLTH